MIKATVYVTIKQGVLDPQGNAVQGALHSMGFQEVSKARVGKYIELELGTDDFAEAENRVKAMCDKLLANTVIEDYRFELEATAQQGGSVNPAALKQQVSSGSSAALSEQVSEGNLEEGGQ